MSCREGESFLSKTDGYQRAIRALLVDGDREAREDILRDLSLDGVEVRALDSLAAARSFLAAYAREIDVVILDLELPDGRGESLLPYTEACSRQPAVIVMSRFLTDLRPEALQYRPIAVAKPISTKSLARIVRTAVDGYRWPLIRRFLERFSLSRREMEAIVMVAHGFKPKECAVRMGCSAKTVYAHLAEVCKKTRHRDYHEVVGEFVAFTCQALGHTPPDHAAFVDKVGSKRR